MTKLMEIDSKPYGKLKVSQNKLINFPQGILGFESSTQYYLLDKDEGPFYWLQSTISKNIAFIVINPIYFKPDYVLKLSKKDFEEIELENNIEQNLLHFVIVTLSSDKDPRNMTANLLGPIIINVEKKIGKQALSLHNEYNTRHNILHNLEESSIG